MYNTAFVWETATSRPRHPLKGKEGTRIFRCMFSRDGKLIATQSGTTTPVSVVRVWDAETGRLLADLDFKFIAIGPIAAFSSDGKLLVTSGGDKAQLWESRTGKFMADLKGGDTLVTLASFSPDGKFIVASDTDGVHVWDASSLEPLAGLAGRNYAFSSDGKLLLTTGYRMAWVWEAGAWYSRREFLGIGDSVSSAAFSPDGKFALTEEYQTARVWDVSTGQNLLVLPVGPLYGSDRLATGKEGQLLVETGRGTTDVYSCEECLPLEELRERARARVTRDLTPSERQYFLHETGEGAKR